MARARNIKPGFFRNELLVGLPFEYRLLFIGLWTIADREGRFEDRPIRIKMELFPADNVDVEAGLQALHDNGFITRYTVSEGCYCQVLAWNKHQNPHVKEATSTIPALNQHGASTVQTSDEHGASIGNSGTSPADSLIPSSLIPDSKPFAQRAERRVENPPAEFDQFWMAYPRHAGRRAAMKAFAKLRPDAELLGKILTAVKRQQQTGQWRRDGGQFIPHAATWLNGRRWEDEISLGLARGDCAGSDGGDLLRRAI